MYLKRISLLPVPAGGRTFLLLQEKQWGIKPRQPRSSSFVCIFPYLPCLALARLRHLRKNPKQKSMLRGAQQFSQSCFLSSQVKSRRQYHKVLSRDFMQDWRKAACENLSWLGSPLLRQRTAPGEGNITYRTVNVSLPWVPLISIEVGWEVILVFFGLVHYI